MRHPKDFPGPWGELLPFACLFSCRHRRSFAVAAETAKPGVMLSNMAPGLALQSTALEACLRLSFPQLKTVSFAHYAPRPSNSLAGKS